MNRCRSFQQILTLPLALSWVTLAIVPGPAQASPPNQSPASIQFIPPVLQNTSEEPGGRSRGGGSRGDMKCDPYTKLAALVPSLTIDQKEVVWGLTTVAQPTFWFYVPRELTPDIPLDFMLQDRRDTTIYETKLKAVKTPSGIVSIRLPKTAALQPNVSYQWTLSVDCSPSKPSDAPFVKGSIQRVALKPELQRQIDALKNPVERSKRLAREGIWYDALTALGDPLQQNRNRDPKLAIVWADLLQQSGLADLVKFPVVPCCQAQPERL